MSLKQRFGCPFSTKPQLAKHNVCRFYISSNSSKESESLHGTLCRCLSLLFDWGVESQVWKSPASFIQESLPFDTLFGMALPLPDGDHALHHVTLIEL